MLASLLLALGIALVGGFLTSLVLSARPVASRALADYYAPTRQTRRERIGLAIARRLPFSLEAWENHLRWAQRNGAYRGDSLGSIFFQCLLFGGLACLVVLVNPAPAAFLLPVGAFAYPLIRLRAKANTARKRVARTLPETAALIAAELAAGVAPETAIARAASLPGPLSALLEEAMQASRESGRPLFSRKPISGTLIGIYARERPACPLCLRQSGGFGGGERRGRGIPDERDRSRTGGGASCTPDGGRREVGRQTGHGRGDFLLRPLRGYLIVRGNQSRLDRLPGVRMHLEIVSWRKFLAGSSLAVFSLCLFAFRPRPEIQANIVDAVTAMPTLTPAPALFYPLPLPTLPHTGGGDAPSAAANTQAQVENDAPFACRLPLDYGRVTQRYGVETDGIVHKGVDYGCLDDHSLVYSPMAGVIAHAGFLAGGLGNTIIVERGGWRVLLGHLAFWNRVVGDTIKAGDVVGICGNSGNSSGPHVHMEIQRWNATWGWMTVPPRNLPGAEGCVWESWQKWP